MVYPSYCLADRLLVFEAILSGLLKGFSMRTAEAIYGGAGMIPYDRRVLQNRVWDYSQPFPQYSPGFLDATGANAFMENQRLEILRRLQAPTPVQAPQQPSLSGIMSLDMDGQLPILNILGGMACAYLATRKTKSKTAGAIAGLAGFFAPLPTLAVTAIMPQGSMTLRNPCDCEDESDCHCDDEPTGLCYGECEVCGADGPGEGRWCDCKSKKNPCPCGGDAGDCHCG